MGRYVNETQNGEMPTSFEGKCEALLAAGAVEVSRPDKFVENLVCVVDNTFFGAAAHLYNDDERKDFLAPYDERRKRYFTWDLVKKYAQ